MNTNNGATPTDSQGEVAATGDHRHDDDVIATTGRAARQQSFGPGGIFGAPAERSESFSKTLLRLGEILGKEVWLLIVVVAFTIGSVLLQVLGPYLLGKATDVVVNGAVARDVNFDQLATRLWWVVIAFVGASACLAAQAWLLAGVVQRSMFKLRARVEDKIHRLSLAYIDVHSRGDLLSRVTNDIDNLAQSLQQTVSQIMRNLLMVAATAVMMFVVSWELALIAMVALPVSLGLIRLIGGRARPRFLAQWRYTGTVNAQAEEVFSGHTVVKAFGRQREAEARFRHDNNELHDASFAAQFTSSLIQPAMTFVGNLQFVAIAVVGGLRIAAGAITIGDMQALIQYVRMFSQPLTNIASMATTFQSGIASLERVLELLDADELSPEPALGPENGFDGPVKGLIEFEQVNFSYDPGQPLIRDLNVTARPGQTIAIVGPTGAGKTTIVNLLMRFYELDSGRITIDGKDIAKMPRAELRSKIGMVLQDTWLFGGTIRDNLAYGNPDATEAEIQRAAKITYVDRFVMSLPAGYDTIINDDGTNISAGEKQLMTIARAFLADPSILILDEATSSVDTRTEVLIQEAMNNLRVNRTSFVIAHRLSTIRGADTILVMEAGRIVEQGNHTELLAAKGAYHDLYMAQFAGESI